MFSRRAFWDLTQNKLAQKKEALLKEPDLIDLTESNPTRCGLLPPVAFLKELAVAEALSYDPDPKGGLAAREAVVSIYAAKGVRIGLQQVLLTSGTSEAYAYLLKLLCDPADEILVPSPSYPLFDYLAGLNDVTPVSYPLCYDGRWRTRAVEIEKRITDRTKAVVAVHPNNPTGSCLRRQEADEIASLCRQRRLPLIADEVFAEYLYEPLPDLPLTLGGGEGALIFCLGGLSKFLGLPQMKLGWIAATGPEPLVSEALARLEMIADTYLSVNTPVQIASTKWLSSAAIFQEPIRKRIFSNRRCLSDRLSRAGACLLAADGGWSAVMEIPGCLEDEGLVLRWLQERHLVVYPGYFFDFDRPGFFVLSLLLPEASFEEGVRRLIQGLP